MAHKIREVERKDVEQVLVMWAAMMSESPHYKDKKFNEKKARSILSRMYASLAAPVLGLVVEGEDGALVGMLGAAYQDHILFDGIFSLDFAVYMKPEHRGGSTVVRLIKLYEAWAKAKGVPENEITLGISTGVEMERTVCLYERLGYRLVSYNMVKKGAG